MDLKEAIEKRHSVRKYKTDPVPRGVVERIVQLARQAPSAGGLRAYKVILSDRQLTPYTAPVNLVICARPERSAGRYGERGRSLYAVQDATIVGAYIQLIAVAEGLATVWVGAFNEGKVRQALGLEDDLRPIAIMPLGYADE